MISQPSLASRILSLKPSPTVEMTERVRKARAAGINIIGLSSGDPNLPTHPCIIEAAYRALKEGETHYSPSAGKLSLREAIARRLRAECGVAYDPGQILITPGGKFGVLAAILSVVDTGDEVIAFDPCWVSYGPCIAMAGGIPVLVPALKEVDFQELTDAISPRTKMMILNSPINPTGRILSSAELEFIMQLAEKHNIWILFDEVYKNIVFEPDAYVPIQRFEGAMERVFVVNSFSKEYGMTGWRIGYMAVPSEVSKSVLKINQHSIYCVPPFIQTAAEAGLALPSEYFADHVAEFKRRRDFAVDRLNRIPGIQCDPPPATFYLFPSVNVDDRKVASEWLDKMDLAVLPGSVFGSEGRGHLRFSLTCGLDLLKEAFGRIERHYGV